MRDIPHQDHEHILRHVVSRFAGTGHRTSEPIDDMLVTFEEFTERIAIANGGATEEFDVGFGLDVHVCSDGDAPRLV